MAEGRVLGARLQHVNNAAVSPKTPFKERLGCLNGDVATWREVFELNFFTPLVLARGFALFETGSEVPALEQTYTLPSVSVAMTSTPAR